MLSVRFWGVRGSLPVPGHGTLHYGGNTSCIEVRAGSEIIIIDGGTGMRLLGESLKREQPLSARIFFTHLHWDHIQGFPFFAPAFDPRNQFDLFGAKMLDQSLSHALSGQMGPLNFPVTLEGMQARLRFTELCEGETVSCGDAVVASAALHHPGGVLGYRIERAGHAVVIATDTEHDAAFDQRLLKLAQGADVLVYDAMYTPEEYAGSSTNGGRRGWGHSTWAAGVELARKADVKQLVLFHHAPEHDDNFIAAMEQSAREQFAGCQAAYEGLVIELGS